MKKINGKKLLMLFIIFCIVCLGFCPIIKIEALRSKDALNIILNILYSHLMPVMAFLAILNVVGDGIFVLRYKFAIVFSELGLLFLWYIYNRMWIYGFHIDIYNIFYFLMIILFLIMGSLPFFVKKNDSSGLMPIMWYDYIWILISLGIVAFYVKLFYNLRYITGLDTFKDDIYFIVMDMWTRYQR